MMKPPCFAPELWRRRYETLRAEAMAGEAGALPAPPLGMYLMVRYGIAGWMRHWPEPVEGCVARGASARSPTPVELPPAPLLQEQLTVLLAQMAFQQLRTG